MQRQRSQSGEFRKSKNQMSQCSISQIPLTSARVDQDGMIKIHSPRPTDSAHHSWAQEYAFYLLPQVMLMASSLRTTVLWPLIALIHAIRALGIF